MRYPTSSHPEPKRQMTNPLDTAENRGGAQRAIPTELPPPAPLVMPVQHVRTVGGLLQRAIEFPVHLLALLRIRRSLH